MSRTVLLALCSALMIGGCADRSKGAAPTEAAGAYGANHLGSAFGTAPEVKVAELVAKADEYRGKTVQVKGRVTAMCTHRKEWFAVVPDEPSQAFVRVVTTPNFLVPDGSIGKIARAEGVVEVTDVPAETAKHFLGEHKLGDPEAVQGGIKQVIIRAAAAEFD
jgi:hypothetical protein